MRDKNAFQFTGNLTRPVELTTTPGGKAVAKMDIAVNYDDNAEYFRITLWEKQAENAAQFLTAGSKVFVEGRLKNDKYEKDGKDVYTTELIAENVLYLSSKKDK